MQLTQGLALNVTPDEHWFSAMKEGHAYGYAQSRSASSPNRWHAQLFNPAGSGKTLYVFLVGAASAGSGVIWVGQHNTELASTFGVVGRNLLNGGAAGVAKINYQANATHLFVNWLGVFGGASTAMHFYPVQSLALVPAGAGLAVIAEDTNQDFEFVFMWVERDA